MSAKPLLYTHRKFALGRPLSAAKRLKGTSSKASPMEVGAEPRELCSGPVKSPPRMESVSR